MTKSSWHVVTAISRDVLTSQHTDLRHGSSDNGFHRKTECIGICIERTGESN